MFKKIGMGCFGVIGALFVLGIIGALAGGGSRTAQTNSTPAAPAAVAPAAPADSVAVAPAAGAAVVAVQEPAAPAPTAAPAVYGVNQDVQVGEVRWKVLEATDLGDQLSSDNEFIEAKKTTGKFVRVRFELENLSKDQLNFAGVNLNDAQGREFTPADDVIGFIPNEELCFLEQLNANVPKVCQVIFEVPADAQALVLIAGDLQFFSSNEQPIDLGL